MKTITLKKLSFFLLLAFLVGLFVATEKSESEASRHASLEEKIALLADHSIIFDGKIVRTAQPSPDEFVFRVEGWRTGGKVVYACVAKNPQQVKRNIATYQERLARGVSSTLIFMGRTTPDRIVNRTIFLHDCGIFGDWTFDNK